MLPILDRIVGKEWADREQDLRQRHGAVDGVLKVSCPDCFFGTLK
jgi:hypothetical protein